ncbi:hypothetical protein H0H93_015636, partial [Arthromyces matolae]
PHGQPPEIKFNELRRGQVILVKRLELEGDCQLDEASESYQLVLVSPDEFLLDSWEYVPIALDRPKSRDRDPNLISLNNEPLEPLRKALEGRLPGHDVGHAHLAMDKLCPLKDGLELRDFIGGSIILDENHIDKIMKLVY